MNYDTEMLKAKMMNEFENKFVPPEEKKKTLELFAACRNFPSDD